MIKTKPDWQILYEAIKERGGKITPKEIITQLSISNYAMAVDELRNQLANGSLKVNNLVLVNEFIGRDSKGRARQRLRFALMPKELLHKKISRPKGAHAIARKLRQEKITQKTLF